MQMTSSLSLLSDGKKLAHLKRSVGKKHFTPRPLYPNQVAEYIEEMVNDLGDHSYQKTAKRLGISTNLISDFLSLTKIPKKYADIWGWGSFKGGRIPWSRFRRAGTFLTKKIISEEDFGVLVNGVLEGQILPGLIEDILYLKKKNPKRSLDDCCREILNLVPKKIKYIIFIADIDESIVQNIRKRALAESASIDTLAESILATYIGQENLKGVLIKKTYIKIALTEKGRQKLDDIIKRNDILLVDIVNHLFTQASL